MPASLTEYLKIRPFAWTGILGVHTPCPARLVWCLTISRYMIGDVRRRAGEITRPA